MSRTITRKPNPTPSKQATGPAAKPKETSRDTIESIVVAFILALLIRGFEAEAFVIPTGSMAPTLYGRHKEVTCPQCGYVYAVNASEEEAMGFGGRLPARLVEWGTCVNCRYQARIDELPTFKGDRILVMKFLYDLPNLPGASPPRRWDVVVFHYPEQPETNYIKRLVGLPNEELRIVRGDIWTRPLTSAPDAPFELQRKPLIHQRAMQINVYDDTHRPQALAADPRWRRWAPVAAGTWKEDPEGTFVLDASAAPDWAELRYRHLVPDPEQWEAVLHDQPLPREPRPTLISDFYSYNTSQIGDHFGGRSRFEPHWVGDLTVSGQLEVRSESGLVRLELIEAGVANRCEIDVASGQATLSHGAQKLGSASTRIKGAGRYEIGFANVDNRLTLWVDGRTPFGEGLTYDDDPAARGHPTPADLAPVGIAARGASVRVSGLVLTRDIYYTQRPGQADHLKNPAFVTARPASDPRDEVLQYFEALADPAKYAALGTLEPRDYPIQPGRYMMMGDNSPMSKDSRGWSREDQAWDPSDRASWEVPAALLIGKAFFVYWPHGKPFGPDIRLSRDFRVPFRPYFERMKWIR
jgi:signal peptidase I